MFKTMAYINSLKGEIDEITVLKALNNSEYLVDYKGIKCRAIYNWFVCAYYVDDIYGRIEQ